ncbi:chitin deacetylase 7 [Wyeomyia smithii]|uniref:chitin deacetylase 7 n=1 Tax=Wyeomyia smithii TaxID=174621 RepID=UPI00246821A5|nr:chitin deacetylase 7 [Wyeomyia smithii]
MPVKTSICLVLLFEVIVLSATVLKDTAPPCNAECEPPNCRCSDLTIPGGLQPNNTPQFVLLTFDDAVTVVNIPCYREVFNKRVNKDSCPVSGTFFVSHEYTDYSLVHELYSAGHEIALHSVSHNTDTEYWRDASVKLLTEEFAGEREMMANFAKIPSDQIKGLRMPFLQMAGNNSFQMMKNSGFTYDCSMPTRQFVSPGMWPYTLDYQSTQDCVIGPCPSASYPGVWVIPMITWTTKDGFPCAMVDTCLGMPNTTSELFEYFKKKL